MVRTAVAALLASTILGAGVARAADAPDAAASAPPPPTATATASGHTPGDPWEPMNRKLFWVHKKLDRYLFRPTAMVYLHATPAPLRIGIRNALNNLGEPVTFLNDVLQLKPKRAATTAARFAINTTVGVAGLIDVATKADIPYHYEDFGQTLGRYGIGPGPYVFIPLLGPSSVRDGIGQIVDYQTSILELPDLDVSDEAHTAVSALDAIDTRATLDPTLTDVAKTATDEYATLRSAYWQNRKAEIADGTTKTEDLPDFDAPGGEPAPATAPPKTAPPEPKKDPSQP